MNDALNGKLILLKHGVNASNRKDKWLLYNYTSFMFIHEPHGTEEQMDLDSVPEDMRDYYKKSETNAIFRQRLWELISTSELVEHYEDIEVPDSFKGTDEEEEPELDLLLLLLL